MKRCMITAAAVIAIFSLTLLMGCHGSGAPAGLQTDADEIVGIWWYSGGIDDLGNAYTLADLPFLQYFRIEFRTAGTFVISHKYCGQDEETNAGTWQYDANTNTVILDTAGFEGSRMYFRNDRLEANDWTGDWTLYFITDETTNPCDERINPAEGVVGDWWYSGGIDDEGVQYALSDLQYLQYIRLTFNADGTYQAAYKYCEGVEMPGGGTWTIAPATGELYAVGDLIGGHAIRLRDQCLETRDPDTGWVYFYAGAETSNPCDRFNRGRNHILGDWWYRGGEDEEGSEYDLSDLYPLEYIRLEFFEDGTFNAHVKYCGQAETVTPGTWSFNPLNGTYRSQTGIFGNGPMAITGDPEELVAHDVTGLWNLYHVRDETRNTCQ
ncbi:MAG: hypothetical protein R6V19_04835 [Armatimonadota bacterium]